MSSLPELALLGYIVQNPEEYPALEPVFRDTAFAFTNDALELLHLNIKNSWNKYEVVPDRQQMKSWLASKQAIVKDNTRKQVLFKAIDRIYDEELDGVDRQIVLGTLLTHESKVLAEKILNLDPHNYEEDSSWIRSRLDVLSLISQREQGQWCFPLDDKWIEDPAKSLSTYLGNPIPLGLSRIDFWLGGGGRRGELIMPAALPEDGKTMFLVTLICNFARAGLRVYCAQCDNTFEEFVAKIWANLAGCSTDDLINPDNHTKYKLQMVRKKYPDIHRQIVIRKWARGTKTIGDLKRDMQMFERMLRPYDLSKGVPEKKAGLFDAFAGDYLDTFIPERQYKEHRFGFDEVSKRVAGLAEETEKLAIFPTQLNRTAKYIEIPDIDNLSEAFTKSHHAAVIPMLFASKAMRLLGKCCMFWAKTRRLRNKFITPMIKDVRTQTFLEDESQEIYYLDAMAEPGRPKPKNKQPHLEKKPQEYNEPEDEEVQQVVKRLKLRSPN